MDRRKDRRALLDRAPVISNRIHDAAVEFAFNWELPEAEIEAGVLEALADVRWPSLDEVWLAASKTCQTKARKRPRQEATQ